MSATGRDEDEADELQRRVHSECTSSNPTPPFYSFIFLLLHLQLPFHSEVIYLSPQGVGHCLRETAKLGPMAFYKVKKQGGSCVF